MTGNPQLGRTRRQTLTLALLFCAGVVNFFDRTSLSVANNTIRAQLDLSATQMGWLLSAFSLAYGFAQLPLIGLIPRFGSRLVLGGGLLLWSAAQAFTGLVRSLPQFLTMRVLLGVGESPFYPAGVQSVRDWFPERTRGRATALMSMSQTLSLAAAPPILAGLILWLGWRRTFVLLGAAGLVVALAWLALYRSPERRAGSSTVASAPPTAFQSASQFSWKSLLRHRMVWGMMLGFGGINYTNWLYTAWIPGYLQTARHLTLERTGLLAAIPFLGGAAGMLSSGVISDALARRGVPLLRVHRRNIVTGMVLSAGSTYLVSRSPSTAAAVAGITAALFFIHFAGTSGWGYAQVAAGQIATENQVASLSALQNFASFLIASAAPVSTGWLLDRTHSFNFALILCSLVTLLGALSYLTLARPPRKGGTVVP